MVDRQGSTVQQAMGWARKVAPRIADSVGRMTGTSGLARLADRGKKRPSGRKSGTRK